MMHGNAVVYCEGSFATPDGKTAHGLVRRSERYRILSVIDSTSWGRDAGEALGGSRAGIPVVENLRRALALARAHQTMATHFVVGLAPDGGRLSRQTRLAIDDAIRAGLHVVSGLHDFISEDMELVVLAEDHGVTLHDVRKPPSPSRLHFFSGKIEQVESLKIAVLGTDSAVGKRTTAWMLVDALNAAGRRAELIGTGQTAWMQGARFGCVMDSLVCDFVTGEIEHAIWSAWDRTRAAALVIEGQGSLMNPAYPGGLEILAAARPDVIVLQHAPGRTDYDGLPGYRIHPLTLQIQALELVSGKPVVAIAVNHENLTLRACRRVCRDITRQTGLSAVDPLVEGVSGLVKRAVASRAA